MAGELNKLSDRKLKGLHGIPASKIEFYADMAKAFLDDKDAQPDKLARYYEYIVKH